MALLPVADALERILAQAFPLESEEAPLPLAFGRVLTADIRALRTQPPADMSAMDGYAVRSADLAEIPARLKVIGEVAAGRIFAGRVEPYSAVRIFTGGVMPEGADAVVIQENVRRDGDRIVVDVPIAKGKHIRKAGLDFKDGTTLLRRGRRLTERDLALAAAMNHASLPVHRRPSMAMLATGDELVPPGQIPGAGQIVYSNGYALTALAAREGASVTDLGIARDEVGAIVSAIERAQKAKADVLVTSGGASVGEYDLVQKALAAQGMKLSFWKIAMRPGRPMMHGRIGQMHVLGLPGNPVSAYVCGVLFLAPLLRRLAGRADVANAVESVHLGCDVPANDERADYLRATLLTALDGLAIANPLPIQDSSMLAPLAAADCLVIREPYAPAGKAGEPCRIVKLPL